MCVAGAGRARGRDGSTEWQHGRRAASDVQVDRQSEMIVEIVSLDFVLRLFDAEREQDVAASAEMIA